MHLILVEGGVDVNRLGGRNHDDDLDEIVFRVRGAVGRPELPDAPLRQS